jgi:hypothetical protein
MEIEVGSHWVHYKGGIYVVESVGMFEETLEPMVGYYHLDDAEKKVWYRRQSVWLEDVIILGENVKRYQRIENVDKFGLGIKLIGAERFKQIELCRWDDKINSHQELLVAVQLIVGSEIVYEPQLDWMVARSKHIIEKYKEQPLHRLAIAGALIAAEIDRLYIRAIEGSRPNESI